MTWTSSFRLPWRMIRPSRWATSAGRQGASRWCRAMARSWTLVPTPIFSVEPTRTAAWPVRQAANNRASSVSFLASCTNLTESAGRPRWVSWLRSSAYTFQAGPGVPRSQNTICSDRAPGTRSRQGGSTRRRDARARWPRSDRRRLRFCRGCVAVSRPGAGPGQRGGHHRTP